MQNAKQLLAKYGSPLYVYDEKIIRERCQDMKGFENALQEKLAGRVSVSMHYSLKANTNCAILRVVKVSGLKIDCMSPFEMFMGLQSGFSADQMLYVCNNITASEMKEVFDKKILICLDSISQVETWGKMYRGTEIMVRINPGTTGVGHSQKVVTSGKATKFGISEENLPELFEVARKYCLTIVGVHQHLGSLFLNDKVPDYIAGVKAGLNIIKKYFKYVKIVDLGGGFGVPYKPGEEALDFEYLTNQLAPVLDKFAHEYPTVQEFKFEPGRFIPCEAGKLFGTVTSIKHENDIWWIGIDIGMGMLVRPSMYGSFHNIELPNSKGEEITANFCGNVCESGDILGEKRNVPMPEVGDTVVVSNAGAYGYSMASNYTGRGRPAEVMIGVDGECRIIRKAETLSDMMQNLIW